MRFLLSALCVFFSVSASASVAALDGAPDNWRELTAGKVVTVITNQHSKVSGDAAKNGGVKWVMTGADGRPEVLPGISQYARDALRETHPSDKVRYRVSEEYAGPAESVPLPLISFSPSTTSRQKLQQVPYGAKQVLLLSLTDMVNIYNPNLSSMIMVVAYDNLPLDVLRRVAFEDGMKYAIGLVDGEQDPMGGDDLIKGRVDKGMLVLDAVVTDVKTHHTEGTSTPEHFTNGSMIGAQIGSVGGIVSAVVFGLVGGTVLSALSRKTTSLDVHEISYKANGEDVIYKAANKKEYGDLKPGDRIKVTKGSFSEKIVKVE